MQPRRPVVLLVAEAVTLAHYARIVALADMLDAAACEVVVAADPRYAALGRPATGSLIPLASIPSRQFARALAQGRRVYGTDTLMRYADDDIRLIRSVKPDLIVGDFRLSLAASAPACGVRYACVVNAYWSPYAVVDFPVPDLPLTRLMGVPVAQKLFDVARKFAFASHARPLARLRRLYRLPPLDGDLRTTYTWADDTLYADLPDYVPMRALPDTHHHIGPPLWSAHTALPPWWQQLPADRPAVLVTMGTSGSAGVLPAVLAALAPRPVSVIVATAGDTVPVRLPANAVAAPFLPFDAVARRCALVICNGGSLTTYGASVAGVPVLGLCTNLDQLLNMQQATRLGTALAFRAGRLDPAAIDQAVSALLDDGAFAKRAAALGEHVERFDTPRRFRAFVAQALG